MKKHAILSVILVLILSACTKEKPIPAPIAKFTFESKGSGVVQFTNLSENADTYLWKFGDGQQSSEKSPSNTYATNGDYTVTLQVKNGAGTHEQTQKVTVSSYNLPKADFSWVELQNGIIQFTNTSQYADAYEWDFGDGTKSQEKDIKYTYKKNDNYTIKLTATSKHGNNVATKTIAVKTVPATVANTKNSLILAPINYAASRQHYMALNANTGEQVWLNTSLDGFVRSSAHVWNDIVFVGDEKAMRALNLKDGTTKWTFAVKGEIYSSPIVANGILYFGCQDKTLYALDALTGAKKWELLTESSIKSAPIVAGGMVFVGTSGVYSPSTPGVFYGLNATDGKVVWSYKGSVGHFNSGAAFYNNELIVCDGYYGNSTSNMIVFEPKTGKILRQFTIPTIKDISNPTVANGLLYIISDGDNLRCIDIIKGTVLWRYSFSSSFYDQTSSPIVENGIVYVCARSSVYAFDAINGTTKWQYTGASLSNRHPLIANGVVYVGGGDGYAPSSDNPIFGIDATTGKALLNKVIKGGAMGPLVIIDQSNKAYYTGLSGAVQ